MKTSNKILTVYGVIFAVFTFGSLGLNVHKYRTSQPAIQACLEGLREGLNKPVLVVDTGMVVSFHRSDYGSQMLFCRESSSIAQARVSGDTLFVTGGNNSFLAAPNAVKRIIKGDRIIDVPPAEKQPDSELFIK